MDFREILDQLKTLSVDYGKMDERFCCCARLLCRYHHNKLLTVNFLGIAVYLHSAVNASFQMKRMHFLTNIYFKEGYDWSSFAESKLCKIKYQGEYFLVSVLTFLWTHQHTPKMRGCSLSAL